MNKVFFILFFFFISIISGQELNCIVKINAAEIGVSNRQVFTTMENAIFEFMNKTKWTNIAFQNQEKIECSLTINILENPEPGQFKGTLQLQVSRPVYNSAYKTPVLSFNDNDISFNYLEYQPLQYNRNNYESNLVSLLTFYVYTILGYHADSFAFQGGENYFREAQLVVNQAQQGGAKGWNQIDGNYTRYRLNDDLLSPVFINYRRAVYTYHLLGLDRMADDQIEAKKAIAGSVIMLEQIFNDRPNTFLIRVFMDTKSDEIVDVFSGGPNVDTSKLREVLLKIFPAFEPKWQKIKI